MCEFSSFSAEAKRKKSEALKGRPGNGYQFKKGYDSRRKVWTAEDRKKSAKLRKARTKEYIKVAPFENLNLYQKKLRILEEQRGECNSCHLSVWQEKPIKLELHHRDGNKQNNSRVNLECLCPNCHSFTENWRKTTIARVCGAIGETRMA